MNSLIANVSLQSPVRCTSCLMKVETESEEKIWACEPEAPGTAIEELKQLSASLIHPMTHSDTVHFSIMVSLKHYGH